jgi:hypothetical protein
MASPRLFWQGRDPASSPSRFDSENLGSRDGSPSPTRRSSIENLKRASRVKNSNMFAREQKQEYNPASIPVVERPLANGRPLTVQGNAFGGRGFDSFRKETSSPLPGKSKADSDSNSKTPAASPMKTPTKRPSDIESNAVTPSKDNVSPIKSSLSTPGRYHTLPRSFDPENGTWSGDDSGGEYQLPPGRVLHRHAKSVTFDAAPPQVNEYEMATPDLSSVGTNSPHAGYDSAEDDDEEESFERGGYLDRDDSFDASLEDTEKTPVVGPEDWRHMSPGLVGGRLSEDIEDPFVGRDGSPMPAARPNPSQTKPDHVHSRTDSVNSNGDRRPLPPIPGFATPSPTRINHIYGNLSATAERVSSAQRDLPVPPRPASISKSDVQGMEGNKMSLEERLRLMMLQDDETSKTTSETQRERRLRRSRSGSRGRSQSQEPEPEHEPKGLGIQVDAEEKHGEELANKDDYKLPPRISRESILRRVKSRSQVFEDAEYDCSTPSPSSSPERSMAINLDPDVPIQSTEPASYLEDTETSVIIKQEEGESDYFDVYSIPEMYSFDLAERLANHEDQEEEDDSTYPQANEGDDDGESHYSDENEQPQLRHSSEAEEDGPPTPRPSIPTSASGNTGAVEELQSHRMSLPEFASLLGSDDFGLGLRSYTTPSPPLDMESTAESTLTGTEIKDSEECPTTSNQQSFLDYGFDGDEGRRTPDSVIRHTIESPKEDSPFVPEPVATIKAPGGRLKTRPSATPADMASMAAARRQVSGEQPPVVPPIPERHRDHRYPSREPEGSMSTEEEGNDNETGTGHKLNHKRSLKRLDIAVGDVGEDLSFGLDKEFDRLIEAQKVAYDLSSNERSRWGSYAIGSQGVANVVARPQRGYLMRQNTKLIVASSNTDENVPSNADHEEGHGRETRSAGNSPRKASHDRTKSWSVEPWNGKARRRSVRDASNARKRPNGVAPPLPGMESNVTSGLENLAEDEPASADQEGGERGRVFVKVVGVKDLDLPLPKGMLRVLNIIFERANTSPQVRERGSA